MSLDVVRYFDNPKSPFATPIRGNKPDFDASGRVARYVYGLLDIAKTHRSAIDTQWDSYYKYFIGKQWKFPNPVRPRNDWQAQITSNQILANIEAVHAAIMDVEPEIGVSATSPDQQPYATTMQGAIDAIYRRRGVKKSIGDASKDSLIYGVGFLKVFWNPDLENGLGDIDVKHVPTGHMFVDPSAADYGDGDRFTLEVKPAPMSYIRDKWPHKAAGVRSDGEAGPRSTRKEQSRDFTGDPGAPWSWLQPQAGGTTTRVSSQIDFVEPGSVQPDSRDRWVDLIECWVQDPTVETHTEAFMALGPDGTPTVYERTVETRKYPYGRLIHVAGGVVLDDQPSEYPLGAYVRIVDISLPSEFYGIGEVELQRDLQVEYNRRKSQMMNYASLMGNAVWIVDNNSMVTPSMLTNRPGLVLVVQPGTRVDRMPPPNMPSWMPMMADRPAAEMRDLMGVSSIVSGMPPRGARTGAAFEAAQSIGMLRMRGKIRNLAIGLERAGRIMVSLIQRYYTTPRNIRIMGSAGRTYFVPFDGRQARGDWDLKIEQTTMMPGAKSAEEQKYIQLFQMRAIDQRALLEKLGIPGYEMILQRMGDDNGPRPAMYPGWPGRPNPGQSGLTGYSTAVRGAPMAPPAGPQGPPSMGPAGNGAQAVQHSGGGPSPGPGGWGPPLGAG